MKLVDLDSEDMIMIAQGCHPEYAECDHCRGYGSSLKDPEGVNTCVKCGGSGILDVR